MGAALRGLIEASTLDVHRELFEGGQGLRGQLGAHGGEVARIAPALRERIPDLPEAVPIADPEAARFRLFEAVSTFLKNVASAAPLLIVLDDLHWADRATLQLLEHLALDVGNDALLLVGAYRDVAVTADHPLEATVGELVRAERFHLVALQGLSRDEVGAYIEALAGAAAPAQTIEAVHRETGGNPILPA